MGPDHEDQATAAAVRRLAGNVGALTEEVARLPERLEELEKREWRSVRLIRALVAGVAVLALLLAATAGVLAWSQDSQDARSLKADRAQVAALARVQRENTAFRQGICRSADDWRTYLASAPAGGPAGIAAATRLEVLFRSLCSRPRSPSR